MDYNDSNLYNICIYIYIYIALVLVEKSIDGVDVQNFESWFKQHPLFSQPINWINCGPHSTLFYYWHNSTKKWKSESKRSWKKKMVLCDATSYIYIDHLRGTKSSRNILNRTNISSFPYLVLMKSAREAILEGSDTSSWWNRMWPESLSLWTASRPFFSSLAVSTTTTPFEANFLHIPKPIPLFPPVTTAYLQKRRCMLQNFKHGLICHSSTVSKTPWS